MHKIYIFLKYNQLCLIGKENYQNLKYLNIIEIKNT